MWRVTLSIDEVNTVQAVSTLPQGQIMADITTFPVTLIGQVY